MGKRKDTQSFVERARLLYGDLYDYSETVYTGNRDRVTFRCNGCGESIVATACVHLRKDKPSGCRKCGVERSLQRRGKSKKCVACGNRLKYSPYRDYCEKCKPWWQWTKRELGKRLNYANQHAERNKTPWHSWANKKASALSTRDRSRNKSSQGRVKKLRLDWHQWADDISFRSCESPWQQRARRWQWALRVRQRMQAAKNC